MLESIIPILIIVMIVAKFGGQVKKVTQQVKAGDTSNVAPDGTIINAKTSPNKYGGKSGSAPSTSMKPTVRHNEAEHTHDRLSQEVIRHETRDEHYRHQIAAFQKAGLIDKKEADVLWKNYIKNKAQYGWDD